MASAYIVRRVASDGPRYVVRYRLGGRAYPVVHGGSFRTMKEARGRRDFIAGELAAARDPRGQLQALLEQPQRDRRRLADLVDAYVASRIDVDEATRENQRKHLRRLGGLAELEPAAVTVADVQEWVNANAGLTPGSLRGYLSTIRLLLDFAGVEPNPARAPKKLLRLPKMVVEEVTPPPAAHMIAMLERTPPRMRFALVTIEQTAMRVGEAASLTWGDVDVTGRRFRLRRQETKSERARWVQVPAWLMDKLETTCPLEDRTPERRVFLGAGGEAVRNVMRRACVAAKVPHYHPHDLRHRRISLWHGQGVPGRELSERAGHARASMSLDVYSHVMPLDEVPVETFLRLLNVAGARARGVPVVSQADLR